EEGKKAKKLRKKRTKRRIETPTKSRDFGFRVSAKLKKISNSAKMEFETPLKQRSHVTYGNLNSHKNGR
ncbi:21493_t:CDS:1, partial [Dentiscutata erythropus]